MNNLDTFFNGSDDASFYAQKYTNHLSDMTSQLDFDAIGKFVDRLLEARQTGKRIFLIGNGGSASTASHFANDIGIGTRTLDTPFKVISLCDNNAVLTAIGNDFGYQYLFSKQLEKLMHEGDILVAISASGNSSNIIDAVNLAKENNGYVVGLTGFDGGKLKELSDLSLHVASSKGEYGLVEDVHMIINHLVGSYLARAVKLS